MRKDYQDIDTELFDKLLDMLRNPDDYSEMVVDAMCQTLETLMARIIAVDSSIISLDITQDEFYRYFMDLLTKYDLTELRTQLEATYD